MMNLRHLSKQSLHHLSRFKPRKSLLPHFPPASSALLTPTTAHESYPTTTTRHFHSTPHFNSTSLATLQPETESDDIMNEFLSRFVYIMRGNLTAAYPDCDKRTVDGMLLVIVEKVVAEMEKGTLESMLSEAMSNEGSSGTDDFSEDLWRTVWEVSNRVCEDMDKQRKKERMKEFLQSEDVRSMARFASEAGVRGDLLRELKFKWAREKMEESDFYEGLKELKADEDRYEAESVADGVESGADGAERGADGAQEVVKSVGIPKRKGKIRYSIYGLDLSDEKWKDAADRIHEAGEVMWPKEAKEITGKCKLVTERLLGMGEEEDFGAVLREWVELLQPGRIDWESLLQRLRERNLGLYYKVAEHVLNELTFETNIRDYLKLIDAYAKENRVEDAERILAKMEGTGISADIPTLTILVHMYCKAGNVDRAKQAFGTLIDMGFRPDTRVYSSMIMAFANAGEPKNGDSLYRQMKVRGIMCSEEIYLALLRAYSQEGDGKSAQGILTDMNQENIKPTAETYTLIMEAYGLGGPLSEVNDRIGMAKTYFDRMIKEGIKPNDRSIASMLATYKRKNMLDKALDLLLQQEKQGFEPGMSTYTALLDWLGELQLVDEAEHVLDKISHLGETPPLKVHVILCAMYSRTRAEKKALQALGVVEDKKDELGRADFERVIKGLKEGGFVQDAERMLASMEALGFPAAAAFQVYMLSKPSF